MSPQQPATQPATHPVTHPETPTAAHPGTQPETPPAADPQSYDVVQPGAYQAPLPAPAATDIAGQEAPASGPPGGVPGSGLPGEAPASGPPASGPPVSGPPAAGPDGYPPSPYGAPSPFGPQAPAAPPAVPGRSAFRILVGVAVVLAAAIVVTAALGWSSVSDLRQGVADRKAEQTRIAQQEQADARKLLDDFRAAALDTKLQRVKDLDKAADVAFRDWRNGGVRFGILDAAMDDCDDAVIAYDSAAGPFPDRLFTSLPKRIDLKNPETDCGRAFTGSI